MKSKLLTKITPGEILEEEFLKPKGITQYRLAKDIGVPPRRINEIVKGQRAITADTSQTSVTNAPNKPLGDSRQTNTSRSFTLPPPPTLDQFTTKDAEVQFQLVLIYERGIFGV